MKRQIPHTAVLFIFLIFAFFLAANPGNGSEIENNAPDNMQAAPQQQEDVTWPDYSQQPQPQSAAPAARQPEDYKERLNQVVSLSFSDIDLKQALTVIAENYDLNILAGDEVKGTVTINFKDVPLGDCLIQMLKMKNFTYRWEGSIIKIVSAEEVVETRAFAVNHITLDLISEIVADKISKDGKIKMNTATNQLIVTDTISKLDDISGIIEEVDMPPAQVRIETKLIDVTHTDLDNLGIKWETADLNIKLPKFFQGEQGSHAEKKMNQLDFTNSGTSSTLTGGQFVLGFLQGSSTVTATIDALIELKKAKVISNPSITTLNNIEARITIGEKYPIREQTQTSTGTLETTRFVDVGTTLKVTPKINNDGTIQLVLHPEVSSVSSAIDAGPRITTREADTTVIVRDGETLIIAGLLQTEDNLNKSRIPILGSLPLVGSLFSSRDKNKGQKELVIFMTPHILNRSDKGAYDANPQQVLETELTGERLNALEMFNKAEDLERGESLQTRVFPAESRYVEAAKNYERICLIYPENYYADIGLFRAAQIYEYKLRDRMSALTCYQKIMEAYPDGAYNIDAKRHVSKLIAKLDYK